SARRLEEVSQPVAAVVVSLEHRRKRGGAKPGGELVEQEAPRRSIRTNALQAYAERIVRCRDREERTYERDARCRFEAIDDREHVEETDPVLALSPAAKARAIERLRTAPGKPLGDPRRIGGRLPRRGSPSFLL